MNDPRPLQCALCGMPRWNDESVRWLGESWENRQPFCTDDCAKVEARRLKELSI